MIRLIPFELNSDMMTLYQMTQAEPKNINALLPQRQS